MFWLLQRSGPPLGRAKMRLRATGVGVTMAPLNLVRIGRETECFPFCSLTR